MLTHCTENTAGPSPVARGQDSMLPGQEPGFNPLARELVAGASVGSGGVASDRLAHCQSWGGCSVFHLVYDGGARLSEMLFERLSLSS